MALGASFVLLIVGGLISPTEEPAQEAVAEQESTPSEPEPTTSEEPSEEPTTPEPDPGTALALLADLDVKGRAPMTGYERDAFGYREEDTDRNGCDVRNDVLRRDLDDIVIGYGTNGCVVESGTLDGPYSGESIEFVRGSDTSSDVQIDHVVALANAWVTGAFQWDEETMREFGNDPMNLLAVDGPLNSQKGDGDAATWLPPNRSFRCEYVAAQVAVKAEYDLWVTPAEHDAMTRVLSNCSDERPPEWEAAPLMPELSEPAPEPEPTTQAPEPEPEPAPTTQAPEPEPEPESEPAPEPENTGTDPQFGTCAEAIDNGLGPYIAGVDPEYDWYRDADSDGIVCER